MSAIFLFLLHFFFRSDPPIVVSHETTYITQPLRSDGLPDYEQYMLDANRKGATHDNNAAVLIWHALWPGQLDPPDYEPMGAELGFKELPRPGSTLQLPFGKENEKRVEAWWKKQHPNSKDIDTLDIMDLASKFAWTSREFPPMAEWVQANKKPLDLIVEASRRPRFYSPSPSLLDQHKGLLITILLPGMHNVRSATDALEHPRTATHRREPLGRVLGRPVGHSSSGSARGPSPQPYRTIGRDGEELHCLLRHADSAQQ